MPTRDNETERNVRIEQDESARKNGRNGKHLIAEASPARSDNSVEKSLEEFIARANSTFLDADGWDLKPEPPPEPPKPEPAPVAVPAKVAATTVSPADVAQAVAATSGADAVAEDTPIAPTDATHVVAREAVAPPPVVVTRTSWGGIFVAFLLGGGLVFGGMKYLQKNQAAVTPPVATQAGASPAQTDPVKPATAAGPNQGEEVTAVQPEAQPGATAPGAPTEAQPGATGAPGEVTATPPTGAVVQPLVQPLPEGGTATPPTDAKTEAKADTKKDTKKTTVQKKDEKKSTAKGGIVDPFGDSAPEPEKKKAPPPKKKKKEAPKGGIVDPFAT